jgi:hypothetical protein
MIGRQRKGVNEMDRAAVVFAVCTVFYVAVMMYCSITDWKKENARYTSELMLKILIKEGKVVLTNDRRTCEDKKAEYLGYTVFVDSERQFWRAFNEFNRISSKLFDTNSLHGRTGVAVCPPRKKLFHYEVWSEKGLSETTEVKLNVMAIPNPKAYRMRRK